MGKGNGTTRSGRKGSSQPQTFEQQVDGALKGLRSDFFQKMEDYYDGDFKRWQTRYEDWKQKDDYIWRGASTLDASTAIQREKEAYGRYNPYNGHTEIGRRIQNDYDDLTYGGRYEEGAKAPSFWDIKKGRANISDATKAVKATAQKTAEKKFSEVRSKMLKTTVEKGIDLGKAQVDSVSGDGFLITDGKVQLHARYIMAWGEIKRPHFRFIITDRKG